MKTLTQIKFLRAVIVDNAFQMAEKISPAWLTNHDVLELYKVAVYYKHAGNALTIEGLRTQLHTTDNRKKDELLKLLQNIENDTYIYTYEEILTDLEKEYQDYKVYQAKAHIMRKDSTPESIVSVMRDTIADLAKNVSDEYIHDMDEAIAEWRQNIVDGKKDEFSEHIIEPEGLYKKIFAGKIYPYLYVIMTRPRTGKCLGKGTKIIMADGTAKKVEDIIIGDYVMGVDSNPRKVLSLARGKEMMYKIKQNKAMEYIVNESHILSLKRSKTEWNKKHGDILNISLKDLIKRKKNMLARYKGYKVKWELPEKELIIDPYFIGLWLGDGSQRCVRIYNPDIEVINYLKDYSKKLGMLFVMCTGKNNDKCPCLSIISKSRKQKSLQELMREMNIINNKHIPDNYLYNSIENRKKLLAGLIDSDGYKSGNCCYEIIQKNKILANQIIILANSIGLKVSIREKLAKCQTGAESIVQRIFISGDFSGVPIRIKRKKTNKPFYRTASLQTGINIEKLGIGDYYGFTLDKDGLFLLEDGTVTHNTALSLNIMKHLCDLRKKSIFFALSDDTVQTLRAKYLAVSSGVPIDRILNYAVTDTDKEVLGRFCNPSNKKLVKVIDKPGLSGDRVLQIIDNIFFNERYDAIFIDYVQRIEYETGKTRKETIDKFMNGLTNICKKYSTTIFLLSQVSRAAEDKQGKVELMLNDAKETGNIDEDARACLVINGDYKESNRELKWVKTTNFPYFSINVSFDWASGKMYEAENENND